MLALTSNPEGTVVQHAKASTGLEVGAAVLDRLASHNVGETPMGSLGAVIGATVDHVSFDLSTFNGPILAPGLGAQGAGPHDLARLFRAAKQNVVPVYARSILAEGPDVGGLRDAAAKAAEECRTALS